jgi:hypothetical protein
MKTFNVTSSGSALSMPHGTYVLASEAQDEINKANADWVERCSKFRKQDAEESDERIKMLGSALENAIKQEEHSKYCDAIKGPEPETWLVEADCNCWVKEARAALEASGIALLLLL